MQDKWKFNNIVIEQPTTAKAVMETTSTSDSGRSMSGEMHNTPMFTIAGYDLTWKYIGAVAAAEILRQFVNKKKCLVHYFDIMEAKWKDEYFYASNFNAPSFTMEDGEETWEELSFNIRRNGAI